MALTGSVKRSKLQGATDVGSNSKSCTARQHITLPTELSQEARLGKATGGHCQLQLLTPFSPTPRLLPDCSLIFSLKLTFKIIFFPFAKASQAFQSSILTTFSEGWLIGPGIFEGRVPNSRRFTNLQIQDTS